MTYKRRGPKTATKKTLTVNVTQEHIHNGIRMKCRHCPVALALNEQHPLPNEEWWGTNGREVFCGLEAEYRLPIAAWQFVDAFDSGRNVKPFTFTLERNDGVATGPPSPGSTESDGPGV